MSDIVVGVRLNADGSGLVGQLKLSRAEMEQLRAAQKGAADTARELSQASGVTADRQKAVSGDTRQAADATEALLASERVLVTTTRELGSVLDRAAASVASTVVETRRAGFQLSDLSTRSEALIRADKRRADASDLVTRNVGLQRAGYQQLGYQLQDISASYASGSRLSVIFAQQSGQLASAIALIAQSAEGGKGKLVGLASFLGGGWGIAISVAIAAASTLIATLAKAGDAADAAKLGANGLSDAQSVLGEMFDLTSGKIKAQNALLVLNARLMAINLRREAAVEKAAAEKTVQSSDDRSVVGTTSAFFARTGQNPFDRVRQVDGRAQQVRGYLDAVAGAKSDAERRQAGQRALKFSETADFSGLSVTVDEFRQAVVNQASSVAKAAIADAIDKSLDAGSLDPSLRKDDKRRPKKDTSAEKAAREVKQLADFSDRAAEAVARMSGEFDAAPRDIDRAAQATRSIDALVKDINERLASSKNLTADQREEFAKIKGDAEALKPIIQQSLIRPFTDMLEVQQRQLDLGKLQAAGRQSDAEALQLTYSLMDKMGVETEDQLATELAKRGVTEDQVRNLYDNLDLLRQQTREMRIQQQVQQMFLGAVGDMRENVRLTLQDLRQDGPKALGDFAKRSLDVFDRLFSEVATEKLFGGLFRDLEDQLTGGDKVSKAGDKLADAVSRASTKMDTAARDILDLGKAAATAAGQISGGAYGNPLPSGWIVGEDGKPFDPSAPADITVTGGRPDVLKELKGGFRDGFEGVFDDLKTGLKSVFNDIFGDRGIFNDSLGKTLGRVAGNAALGGASGSMVTGLLGIKGSGTGGMLGGAIGGALGKELLGNLGSFAGPLGSIAGGVIGSVVGGMLKKTKTGAANITSVDGDASLSGNSASFKKAAGGAASSVQDGLARIADTLGASIGAFNVTIGQRHGDWRVREGTGSLKVKKGAAEFDDDQAGAVAYAIQLAVSQGAVTGLSAAMDKALRSSPDIDKAIAEALKVQEVEQMLGGLGSQLASQFKAFEAQAKERVRIATQYGFDVVAIEKRNAEDRAKLVDQILTDRVGSLQGFLDDMKYGDLATGSAADKRTALLGQIASVRADAEAGKDGAADKLASLLRQLVQSTEDAFGTAGGELASDRATAANAAEAVIKAENERIRSAQDATKATNAELSTISSKASETNDLLSQIATDIANMANGAPPPPKVIDTDLVAIGL